MATSKLGLAIHLTIGMVLLEMQLWRRAQMPMVETLQY